MAAPLQTGDLAPDFRLRATSGEDLRLSNFAGRKVVLYFYPKDDTSGCTREAMEFNALRSAFSDVGADIVGISPDGLASHVKFKAKYDLELVLASDESKDVCASYGVWVEKSMYGRKYMGVERTTFLIGGDGRIAGVWRNVKVPGHAQAVLEAAQALQQQTRA